jgi:hypothetical protein
LSHSLQRLALRVRTTGGYMSDDPLGVGTDTGNEIRQPDKQVARG